MATGGLYGSTSTGTVAPQSGSESVGLYGNNTVFGGTYFEWFIFQVSETQPATPTGGSWNFTTNIGTPPSGWTAQPPVNPISIVWVSIGLVNSKSTSSIVWSTPGKFSFTSGLPILSGTANPSAGDGQTNQLYIQTSTTPESIWFKQAGTWTLLTGSTLYMDTTSTQTIAGTKTFSSPITGSVTGTSANVTGVVSIANGGTGTTTANSAFNALAPVQTGNAGKFLTTDGLNSSWSNNPLGTVTSVAATVPSFLSISGSPITTSGTLAIGYSGTALPVANGGTGAVTLTGYVYGNGTSAMTASTTIPTTVLSGTVTNAQLTNSAITINGNSVSLGGSTTITSATISPLTIGTGLSGTSFNGSTPITIALATGYGDTLNPYASKTANYVLAAPNGSAGVPTFRAIVAADIPTLNQNTTGTAANITASSNSTLTTLSALSLPGSQVSGNISGNAANVTGVVAVANGGSGVSVSSGVNSIVLRDANANITVNSINESFSSVAAAGTTTVLIASSAPNYVVTGSGGQTYQLPDATTLANGINYTFNNNQSSGTIVVKNNSSTTVATVQSGGFVEVILLSNATAAGSWDLHNFAPSNVSWSTNTFDYSGSITSATWNGTAVAINRGGTGQTTASAAFNALSPITSTGDLILGNGTNSATRLGIGANGYVLTSNGTTASWAAATGGVSQIVAGTNVTISPSGGTGVVTINASGGGGGSSAYTRTTFTATAGQTAFTVTYAVGYLQIYVNGVLLTGSDYTATSGTGFTLAVACAAGDIVEALVITTSVTGVTTGKSIAMALIFGY